MDIGYLVRRAVGEHGAQIALRCGDQSRTYAQLDERAQRLANGLRARGLRPGDHVAVLLENRVEYPEVDLGLAYAGLVRVALNARLGLEDFSFVLDDAEIRAVVTENAFDPIALELVDRHDVLWVRFGDDAVSAKSLPYEDLLAHASPRRDILPDRGAKPAWISYTSGTTGRPKGVVLSHAALAHVAFNTMLELGPLDASSSIMLPQPLSHGAGYFVLPYLAVGATVHVVRRFNAEQIVAEGRQHAVKTLKLVPTMLLDLLDQDLALPFETVIYGASPINRLQLDRALDRFGPVFIQIYGQSECPMTITCLKKIDHSIAGPHLESAGKPWRTVKLRIMGDDGQAAECGELGEVVVNGPHAMDGYHRRPELTADVLRDGWIWTRDMGLVDERGYVYLRGRRDEMINSGGFNISPKEIETVISSHPDVDECVVVGVPDERWGEAVRVYVTPRAGERLDPTEIISFSRPTLTFRRPRSVVIVERVPKTAYGKVDRAALQALKPIAAREESAT